MFSFHEIVVCICGDR